MGGKERIFPDLSRLCFIQNIITFSAVREVLPFEKGKSLNYVVIEKGCGSELHSNDTISTPHTIDIGKTQLWLKGEMYLDNVFVREVIPQIER